MPQQNSHCRDCRRPLATAEHEGTEPGLCFAALNPRDTDMRLD
jgi:hypothetical protein